MANRKKYHRTLMNDKKICGICMQYKDIDQFWKDGHGKIDSNSKHEIRRWFCKECGNKINNGIISKEEVSLKKSHFNIFLEKKEIDKQSEEIDKNTLVSALIELSRHDLNRLFAITKHEFIKKTNANNVIDKFNFDEIKLLAKQELYNLGLHRSKTAILGKGRYLIVGDSHGKHTKKIMFELLHNLNNNLKFDKIIHIGHILDDDNVISYCWKDFDNLLVIAKQEEAKCIEEVLRTKEYKFEVVRQNVVLGNICISNQDIINDYVKSGIELIDSRIYKTSTIVNSHKHEFDTRCAYNRKLCYATPGSICEKHIVKTIRQIDFTSGYQLKIAYPSSFVKYRKMNQLLELWEQGLIIIEVDEYGDSTIVMCRIKRVGEQYATAYFDKIYCGNRVYKPENKIFINSDLHIPQHSNQAIEIQDKIVKDYKPDIYVNLGDIHSGESLNHHKMSRGEVITSNYTDELYNVNFLLKKMSNWAKKKYLMLGNHERFIQDFAKKYPQLEELLMEAIFSSVKNAGYELILFKDVLNINGLKFIHGDFKMYGQKGGNFLVKIANTFAPPVVVGHLHYIGIKSGSYMIGLSAEYNQRYNEINASNWLMGFGICNQYKGESFVNTIPIINNKVIINKKTYVSKSCEYWKKPECKIEIKFNYSNQ